MKSLVVSVCITAVTDMAAVSLLVFSWCSSGVLYCVLLCVAYRTPEEHQNKEPETPEEPRRKPKTENQKAEEPQKEKNMPMDTGHGHQAPPFNAYAASRMTIMIIIRN